MHSATGQYSTHAGDPAQPVQHSLITARMCGLRLRCVVVPVEIGSYLTTGPARNSSILGAPYDTRILQQTIARIYSCRPRISCQSGRADKIHKLLHAQRSTLRVRPVPLRRTLEVKRTTCERKDWAPREA